MAGLILAAVLNISAQEPAQNETPPPGMEEFTAAYSLYMDGDLPAARAAFEKTSALPECHPDYAANAVLMAGILNAVMNDTDAAFASFEQVRAMTNAVPTYKVDAEINMARLLFWNDDLAAASNMLEQARASLSKLTWTLDYGQVSRIINLYDDYLKRGRWGLRGQRDRIGTQIEQTAKRTVLERQLNEQGLTPERRYLRGEPISGPWERYPAYPAACSPYRWDFDDNTFCGIDRTNGIAGMQVADGCLSLATGTNAMFGWGKNGAGDPQNRFAVGYGSGYNHSCVRICAASKSGCVNQCRPANGRRRRAGKTRGRISVAESKRIAVKGTNWQEVFLPLTAKPPISGVQIVSATGRKSP